MARREGARDQLWDGERNHRQESELLSALPQAQSVAQRKQLYFSTLIVITGASGLLF